MSRPAFRVTSSGNPPRGTLDRGGHFIGQSVHLVNRIRDHIERLDDGVEYAVDDLAVVMRAMLSNGRGNDVLGRLHRLANVDVQIQLSRAPNVHSPHFSIGSVPIAGAHADQDGAVWVPLARWAHTPVLRVVGGGEQRNYRWGAFLDTYANKWGGAHIDKEIPAHLPIIDVYEAGGHLLSAYLIRSAAVQAWLLGQALLTRIVTPQVRGRPDGDVVGVGSPGSIDEPPADRRHKGELQFLDYTGDACDLVAYIDGKHTATVRFAAGDQLTYDLVLKGELDEPGSQTQRVRTRMPPEEIVVSRDRTMKTSGTVRLFSQIDPAADQPAAE